MINVPSLVSIINRGPISGSGSGGGLGVRVTVLLEELRGVDFGLGIGASYVHPPTGFGVDGRYNLGLTDISEGNGDAFNRGFQFGVFYLFKHKS